VKRKVLASLLVIAVVAGLVGASTFALFSDVETSEDNIFQAGTLDLEVGSPSDLPITLTNMAPGVESGDFNITWKNVGSLAGQVKWHISAFADADGAGSTEFGPGDISAADFAKKVYVTKAYFDRNGDGVYDPDGVDNILGSPGVDGKWGTADDVKSDDDEDVLGHWIQWTEVDPVAGATLDDGKASLYEMAGKGAGIRYWTIDDSGTGAAGPSTILDPGDKYKHQLRFELDSGVGNPYQAEGVEVTITIELNQ